MTNERQSIDRVILSLSEDESSDLFDAVMHVVNCPRVPDKHKTRFNTLASRLKEQIRRHYAERA